MAVEALDHVVTKKSETAADAAKTKLAACTTEVCAEPLEWKIAVRAKHNMFEEKMAGSRVAETNAAEAMQS